MSKITSSYKIRNAHTAVILIHIFIAAGIFTAEYNGNKTWVYVLAVFLGLMSFLSFVPILKSDYTRKKSSI
jgi:hypothetical protein